MHWAHQYIGKAWGSGAQGPDAFDCWGLVRHINKEVYGRELPEVIVDATNLSIVQKAFYDHEEFKRWQEVKTPAEGDCVITKSSPSKPEHIGIYVDEQGGRILQSVYGSGVVALSIEATKRFIGQHIEFWRWVG